MRRIYRQILISMFIFMLSALLMQPLLFILPLGAAFLLPTVCVFTRRYYGMLPTYVLLFSLSFIFFLYISGNVTLWFMVLVVPSSLLAIIVDKQLKPFGFSAGIVCAALFLGGGSGLLQMQMTVGLDVFYSESAWEILRNVLVPPDWLLFSFIQRSEPATVRGVAALTPELRQIGMQYAADFTETLLRYTTALLLVGGSFWGGVFAAYFPRLLDRRSGSRRGPFPNIREFFLPMQTRFGLLALLLLGVLAFFLRIPGYMMVYLCIFEIVQTAYAFEGAGLLAWRMKKGKRGRSGRIFLLLLLFFLLRPMLMIVGIIDQFANPRKLEMNRISTGDEEGKP